jgi:oxygen-independent coproporphyrinogen-3 oxidase
MTRVKEHLAEPATAGSTSKSTEVGSVFVSNYPPYSFWRKDAVLAVIEALNRPVTGNTLGLYLHIPFCRKRCKFCYFRVYTDKNSAEISRYLDALAKEIAYYAEMPAVTGRPLDFIYFGGGTPSYISVRHLKKLVESVKRVLPWSTAKEITFECEPGTLSRAKLEAIREIGVTRLSLGIENFDEVILQANGRAHLSGEIYQVMPWVEALAFEQLNIDLIAGMVGETWETWKENVRKAVELQPDSVTIYQMELPFNTVFSKMLSHEEAGLNVADWPTKREWHAYAIEQLADAGYELSSAYTMVKDKERCRFVYRDWVWRGTDMVGTGVASFSHLDGFHFQNSASWDEYLNMVEKNELPITRAFKTSQEERLVREVILQLKLGRIEAQYFRDKFDVDIVERFSSSWQALQDEGALLVENDGVTLTRAGLLRVDQLLPAFYHGKYRNARYT